MPATQRADTDPEQGISETELGPVNPRDPGNLSSAGRAKGRAVAAENRARRIALKAEVKALEIFERAAPSMAQVLVNAAQGKQGFERLSPKERASFAIKVLEYGVGRPRTAVEVPGPVEATAQAQGLHFGVGSPQGDLLAAVGGDPGTEGEELAAQRVEQTVEIIPDGTGEEYVLASERERLAAEAEDQPATDGDPVSTGTEDLPVSTETDVSPGALADGSSRP